MTILVDSDILIEVLRGRDPQIVADWLQWSASTSPVLFSPVSEAELWAGARPKEHQVIGNLFQSLQRVPVNSEIGRLAGDYLRQYSKSHSVELGDSLIAASAVLNGAALWTRNRKHYPMRGLSLFSR
jgi:predicted nucleic acid-binding protein